MIEILLVAGLLGVLATAVLTVLLSARRTWGEGSGQAYLNGQLRKTLNEMIRELEDSSVNQIVEPAADGNWDTTVLFRYPQDQDGDQNVLDPNGSVVEWSTWTRYLLGAGNTLLRNLSTVPAVTTQTLAGNISNIRFRRQVATPDVVEVELTATTQEGGRVVSRTAATRVKLRNLQLNVGDGDPGPPEDF